MSPKEMSEAIDKIETAREEYLARLATVQELTGPDFDAAAGELGQWIDATNRDLNDAAQKVLADGMAVDGESLAMLQLERLAG